MRYSSSSPSILDWKTNRPGLKETQSCSYKPCAKWAPWEALQMLNPSRWIPPTWTILRALSRHIHYKKYPTKRNVINSFKSSFLFLILTEVDPRIIKIGDIRRRSRDLSQYNQRISSSERQSLRKGFQHCWRYHSTLNWSLSPKRCDSRVRKGAGLQCKPH